MTYFEHKSGKGQTKQPLGSDPMLELTRLFGSRPRPVSARVSYGGESQNTSDFSSYDDIQGPEFFTQNLPEGSIDMSGRGGQGGQRDQGEGTQHPQGGQRYQDDNYLPPYYEEDTPPNFVDSTQVHETQWTGFEEGETYDGYQDDNHGMMVPPSFVSPILSTPAPAPAPAAPSVQMQKPVLQPSEISNISFGYGHSVQIKPRVFSPPPPPEPEMRQADLFGRGEANQPQVAFHQESDQTGLNEALHDFDLTISNDRHRYQKPAPQPQPLQPSHPTVDPAAATVPIGASRIETTDPFDLPPVPYEGNLNSGTVAGSATLPRVPIAPPPLSPTTTQGDVVPPSALPQVPPLSRDPSDPTAIYDWGAPKAVKSAKAGGASAQGVSRGVKRFYGFVVILLLFALGVGGYFASESWRSGELDPITITADPEEVRIVPQQPEGTSSSPSETDVYDGTETGGGQGTLLDGREAPLNLEKINEQPPLSNESSLEPRTVEDSILHALSRAIPVHMVPTVMMGRNEEGNLVDVSPNNDAPGVVVRPGVDYSASIANARAIESTNPPAQVAENQPVGQQAESVVVGRVQQVTDMPTTSSDDMPLHETQATRLPSTVQPQDDMTVSRPNVDDTAAGRAAGEMAGEAAASNNNAIPTTRGQIDASPPATVPDKPQVPLSPPPLRVAENADAATLTAAPVRTSSPPSSAGNATSAGGEGDFYVQIASQPTQAAARQSADEAKERFASLIGGRQVSIVPADIPGRGTYYRVRIATGERSAAINLCEQYKQAGGSCFIGR